jgi:hypothetical protein
MENIKLRQAPVSSPFAGHLVFAAEMLEGGMSPTGKAFDKVSPPLDRSSTVSMIDKD